MKLSIFFDHILKAKEQTGRSLEELLSYVHDCGIEAVEMDYDYMAEREEILARKLKKADLSISCVYGFCHLGENPDEKKCFRIIDMAKRQNCRRVLIVPGFLPQQEADVLNAQKDSYEATAEFLSENQSAQNMRQGLVAAVAYAAEREITVTLEDFDGNTAPYAGAFQLKWFMEQVPGLRWTLDTGNFAYSNEDVLWAAGILEEYTVHIHCKDRGEEKPVSGGSEGKFNRGLRPVPVGEGYIPVKQLVKLQQARGYDGYLAIEQFGLDPQYEGIAGSAKFLKDCLGA